MQSLVRTRSNTCQNTTAELWPSALSFYVINYENCSACLRAKCKESPFVSSSWLADSIVTLWRDRPCWTQKTFIVQMETLKREWRKQWPDLTCAEILLWMSEQLCSITMFSVPIIRNNSPYSTELQMKASKGFCGNLFYLNISRGGIYDI